MLLMTSLDFVAINNTALPKLDGATRKYIRQILAQQLPKWLCTADCKRLVTQRQEARQVGDSYVVVSPHRLMTHLHEKKSCSISSINYLTVQPTLASQTLASQTLASQTLASQTLLRL
jgi:hypothetical protein